jgi:PKHD-type hydroxylase
MSAPTMMVNNELVEKMFFIPRFIVDNEFFTHSECDFISQYFESNHTTHPGGEYFDTSHIPEQRKANVVLMSQPDEQTIWMWEKFNNIIAYYNDKNFNFDLYGFNYLQFAKYNVGDKHEFHMDLPLGGKTVDHNLMESLRKLTVVLLLNEPGVDFEGGNFQINHFSEQFPWETNLKKGSVLLFPSFLLHKVAPIISGNRQSITVWAVGPKFK